MGRRGRLSRRDVSRLGQVQLFSGLQRAMQLTSCWGGLAGRGDKCLAWGFFGSLVIEQDATQKPE